MDSDLDEAAVYDQLCEELGDPLDPEGESSVAIAGAILRHHHAAQKFKDLVNPPTEEIPVIEGEVDGEIRYGDL